MQEVEKTMTGAVDLCFLAVDTDVKRAFFRFIEVAITDMVHHGLMGKTIRSNHERWTHSDILVN